MAIDKETIPDWFNIVMLDSKENLKAMRTQANEDSQNDDESILKKMSFTGDKRSIQTEEYYFEDGSLYYSASVDGDDNWFSFQIPISDKVLIDILQYSMKKLGKLKTALETLK